MKKPPKTPEFENFTGAVRPGSMYSGLPWTFGRHRNGDAIAATTYQKLAQLIA